jgi:putative mRNA 3-end processing factor
VSLKEDITMQAAITHNGAVLLGENVVCDSHAKRALRVVTHAHSDHLRELKNSFIECEKIVTTPATKELLGILRNVKDEITTLDYEKTLGVNDEKIIFYDAGHIIGSAQVLLENGQGKRIVYTGDFKLPKAKIIDADILVMEATYGNPKHVRWFKEKVEEEFAKLVWQLLKLDSVYIFGYHGKLQETLAILKKFDINVPVVVPDKVYEIAAISEKYGMKLAKYYLSTSDDGRALRKERHIGVYHIGSSKYVGEGAFKIKLSGWQFSSVYRKVSEKEYIVALSDHSDFEDLMTYVEKSKPELVITDNYRVGDAHSLAHEIERQLGIKAIPMP